MPAYPCQYNRCPSSKLVIITGNLGSIAKEINDRMEQDNPANFSEDGRLKNMKKRINNKKET